MDAGGKSATASTCQSAASVARRDVEVPCTRSSLRAPALRREANIQGGSRPRLAERGRGGYPILDRPYRVADSLDASACPMASLAFYFSLHPALRWVPAPLTPSTASYCCHAFSLSYLRLHCSRARLPFEPDLVGQRPRQEVLLLQLLALKCRVVLWRSSGERREAPRWLRSKEGLWRRIGGRIAGTQ